ncbi:MAG: hypothetical protein J0M11_03895 [Anaerolineae bacterium]|nr:hypothetical protein [Anaerolineae bacterium]
MTLPPVHNVADIRPNFRDDIHRTLSGIYLPASVLMADRYMRTGFALALSSVAINYGINPSSFLKPEDVQLLKCYPDSVG